MKSRLPIFFFLFLTCYLKAQDPTIGLLKIDHDLVSEGYTLFSPWNSKTHYLINNCGEKVHSWDINLPEDLKMPYLDEEGNLWLLNRHSLYKYDWDSNLEWSFVSYDYGIIAHHDFEIMPNGNFMLIAWEDLSNEQAAQIGIDTTGLMPDSPIRIDGLYEYKVLSPDSFELVWKWNFKDHFVQDIDTSLNNYGLINDFYRKLDINFSTIPNQNDWLHCNGLDYNENLDQLVISSRNSSEIYIIDHSTSIEEAASSHGGNQGHGGDFLWRFGNQNLNGQHDPNWIPDDHPNQGMISVFNNISEIQDQSNVVIVDPKIDSFGSYQINDENQFLPIEPSFIISSTEEQFFSPIMSGAHSLKNGNFILCTGVDGYFYEMNLEGELIWKYRNPVFVDPLPQYTFETINFIFNIKKYSSSYLGFQDKDLSPKGLIEDLNPISEECKMYTHLENPIVHDLKISPNPSNGEIYFETEAPVEYVQIFTVSGIMLNKIYQPDNSINLNLENGSYIVQFNFRNNIISKLVIVNN